MSSRAEWDQGEAPRCQASYCFCGEMDGIHVKRDVLVHVVLLLNILPLHVVALGLSPQYINSGEHVQDITRSK